MPKGIKSAALCSFIKGYLPVRVRLLQQVNNDDYDDNNDEDDENVYELTQKNNKDSPIVETFMYMKENHIGSSSAGGENTNEKPGKKGTGGGDGGATIFVANCPIIPNITTKLLLQSIFGRFGDVTRVTVVPKPTAAANSNNTNRMASYVEVPYEHEPYHWTDQYAMKPSYYKQNEQGQLAESFESEGKFAHVVFASPKEMKRTFRIIHEIMSTTNTSTGTSKGLPPAVSFDPIEIQTLLDESDRLRRQPQQQHPNNNSDNDGDEFNDDDNQGRMSAVQIIAQQYRNNCQQYIIAGGGSGSDSSNRHQSLLLDECNRIMELYEDLETAAERQKREITSKPDEDGFITVSYTNTAVSTTNELEQTHGSKRSRSSDGGTASGGSKRLRTNKKKKGLGLGSLPIPDFYRFQTREHQQNSITELRQRFEQDKLRIQQMKDRHHT